MNLAIVGGTLTPETYKILDTKLNELIEEKQYYLFTVLCGAIISDAVPADTLGKVWAEKNGAPVRWIFEPTAATLQNKLLKEADYIIFIFDGNTQVKNLMMRYKMMGKHGSVIQV